MGNKFIVNLKRSSYRALQNVTTAKNHRRIIEKFTDKTGMVYFGSVSQHKDEHRLIRGFTASSTHKDNHFSVGTVDGYDISIVERNDVFLNIVNKVEFKNWLIIAIDLKNGNNFPYIFIKPNNHNDNSFGLLFATHPTLSAIKFGTFEKYPAGFTDRFSVYSMLENTIEVEKILPADSLEILSKHLWPYSIEVVDGVMYIYSDNEKISHNSLTTMLNVGLWVARHLDSMINQI